MIDPSIDPLLSSVFQFSVCLRMDCESKEIETTSEEVDESEEELEDDLNALFSEHLVSLFSGCFLLFAD